MTERAANLFRENQQVMFQSVAPEGQTNLGLDNSSLASSFNGAVGKLAIAPTFANNDNKVGTQIDKQGLVDQADMAGYSLQQCLQIAPAPKNGDVGYTTAKFGEACTEFTSQVFNIFGAQPDEPKMDGNNGPAPYHMAHNPQIRPGMGLGMG